MENDLPLRNRIKELRSPRGLSQNDIARAADVSRQTIGGIESGRYSPSATVAMRIARALGARVDDVFWLGDAASVEAIVVGAAGAATSGRAALARVGDRWVAHALDGGCDSTRAIRPADGLIQRSDGIRGVVQLLEDEETLSKTVSVAGCAPALEVWARTIERDQHLVRANVVSSNSMHSLEMLGRGEVHLACIHFADGVGTSSAPNRRTAAAALAGAAGALVSMGAWNEGLLVARGNPKAIRSVSDIGQRGIRFVNREPGAASRRLFDSRLASEGVPTAAISGYQIEVTSPAAIAGAIASAVADVGIGVESVALCYGLDFIPIAAVHYDLVYLDQYLNEPVKRLIDTLGAGKVRAQFASIGCSETRALGEPHGTRL